MELLLPHFLFTDVYMLFTKDSEHFLFFSLYVLTILKHVTLFYYDIIYYIKQFSIHILLLLEGFSSSLIKRKCIIQKQN